MDYYNEGREDVLRALGISKVASPVAAASAAVRSRVLRESFKNPRVLFDFIAGKKTPLIQKAPWTRRAKWWLQEKLPQWGRTAKEMAVGEPSKFLSEVSRGKALAPGSLVRKSFHAPGVLNKVFWYGFPAYEGINIMRSDDPNKAGRMGGLIGGTALGIGAFRPLGMVGSMGLGMLGERVGAGIGRTAKHLAKGPDVDPRGKWVMQEPMGYQGMQGALPQYPAFQNRSWVNR